jgi:hypothetical protein
MEGEYKEELLGGCGLKLAIALGRSINYSARYYCLHPILQSCLEYITCKSKVCSIHACLSKTASTAVA